MRKLKSLLVILLVFGILIASIAGIAYADCDHSSLGKRYCEASHPHAYYRTCQLCGQKIYDGTYGTKNHGDGSWGSGTCPQCGTHTYVGQTCTNVGTCACGATVPALGHSLYGNTWTEAEHPHYYYKDCARCGEHVRTGGNGTRLHGDGTGETCTQCPMTFASLLAYKELDEGGTIIERNSYFDEVSNDYSSYGSVYTNFYESYTKSDMKRRMQASKMFYIHTHGNYDSFLLSPTVNMTRADLSGVDLSEMKFLMLIACSCAQGGYNAERTYDSNLLERLISMGVTTAIAFSDTIYTVDGDIFAEQFTHFAVELGHSVYLSIALIPYTEFIYDSSTADKAVIGGNSGLFIINA